jgi:hypothetical protein
MTDGKCVDYLLLGRQGSAKISYTLNGHINFYTTLPHSIKELQFKLTNRESSHLYS